MNNRGTARVAGYLFRRIGVASLGLCLASLPLTAMAKTKGSSESQIPGWGGVQWGASEEAVLAKYPVLTAYQPDPSRQDFSLELKPKMIAKSKDDIPEPEVTVPGVDVESVLFQFKDGKLVALNIAGTLLGDLAGSVVGKYGPARESAKKHIPFDEESDHIWRDKQGNGLVLRMFMKSHSVYLDYYSAPAMKRRDQETVDAERKKDSSL
ncbi:MAG TPA: hypothetical protein VFG23_14780 [Polyangia bacterium]|nr:hypothetical protein [Polyangia bacterium]